MIFDRCEPKAIAAGQYAVHRPSAAGRGLEEPAKVDAPQIIDIDRSHPLMQLLELGDVLIAEGTPLEPPARRHAC